MKPNTHITPVSRGVTPIPFNDHGNKRRHQRCPSGSLFDLLLAHFDRDIDVGGDACSISISPDLIQKLLDAGHISLTDGERLAGLAAVLQNRERGVVIKTVIKGRNDPRLGKYLRQRKKPWRVRRRHRGR